MKEFLNRKRLEVNVQDITGQNHVFILNVITPDVLDNLTVVTDKLSDTKEKPGSMIKRQLVILFGKDETFYSNFDIGVLKEVLDYVNKQMTNPTKET